MRIGPEAKVSHNLVSNGCVIDGTVSQSVLSPGVKVAAGATVTNSVIMRNVTVERGARIDRCVIDVHSVIEENVCLGYGTSSVPNRELPEILNTGLTLVGRSVTVPAGMKVGRNVQIHAFAAPSDFDGPEVTPGGVVGTNPRTATLHPFGS